MAPNSQTTTNTNCSHEINHDPSPFHTPTLNVGDRIQYQTHRGTLHYVGTLPERGATIWAGIEWDDVTRGKHSGNYLGHHYFHVHKAGAGTFLKLQKLLPNGGRISFLNAVHERYVVDAHDDKFNKYGLLLGGGAVEIVMQNKWFTKLEQLTRVDVSNCGVAFLDPILQLRKALPKLKEISVAKCLFKGSAFLHELLETFSELKMIDVSGNMLLPRAGWEDNKKNGMLKELVLNGCELDWYIISDLCIQAGSVEELRIHACGLGKMPSEKDWRERIQKALYNVKLMDLDGNDMQWDDIIDVLGRLQKLEQLYLSKNKLSDKDAPKVTEGENREIIFAKLQVLSIAENEIEGWGFITWLGLLPCLKQLRIRGNVITPEEQDTREELGWLVKVIGRIAGLERVDGSIISKDERLLCERKYGLEECMKDAQQMQKMYKKDWIKHLYILHPRVRELWESLGVVVKEDGEIVNEAIGIGTEGKNTIANKAVLIKIIAGEGVEAKKKEVCKKMPPSATASVVVKAVRRLLKVDAGQDELHLEIDGRQIGERECVGEWNGGITGRGEQQIVVRLVNRNQ